VNSPNTGLKNIKSHPLPLATVRRGLIPLIGLAAVFTLLVVPMGKPIEDHWGAGAWNLLHIPAFALVTVCISRLFAGDRNSLRCRVYSASLAMVAGIASEAIQSQVGRSASFQDLVFDFIGILLAVSWPHRPETWTVTRRGLWVVSILGGITLAFAPGLRQWLAEDRMRSELPEIGNFLNTDARRLWKAQGEAVTKIDSESGALQVSLAPGAFGGINFLPGHQDWSGYSELVINLSNPGSRLLLGVRIDDENSAKDRVWFSDQAEVGEGVSEVRIELPRAGEGGQKREIDLSRTRRLVLFVEKNEIPVEFSIISAVLH